MVRSLMTIAVGLFPC